MGGRVRKGKKKAASICSTSPAECFRERKWARSREKEKKIGKTGDETRMSPKPWDGAWDLKMARAKTARRHLHEGG